MSNTATIGLISALVRGLSVEITSRSLSLQHWLEGRHLGIYQVTSSLSRLCGVFPGMRLDHERQTPLSSGYSQTVPMLGCTHFSAGPNGEAWAHPKFKASARHAEAESSSA